MHVRCDAPKCQAALEDDLVLRRRKAAASRRKAVEVEQHDHRCGVLPVATTKPHAHVSPRLEELKCFDAKLRAPFRHVSCVGDNDDHFAVEGCVGVCWPSGPPCCRCIGTKQLQGSQS